MDSLTLAYKCFASFELLNMKSSHSPLQMVMVADDLLFTLYRKRLHKMNDCILRKFNLHCFMYHLDDVQESNT